MCLRLSPLGNIFARSSRRPATAQVRTVCAVPPAKPIRAPLPLDTELRGDSDHVYRLARVLMHRERPFTCVYLAQYVYLLIIGISGPDQPEYIYLPSVEN